MLIMFVRLNLSYLPHAAHGNLDIFKDKAESSVYSLLRELYKQKVFFSIPIQGCLQYRHRPHLLYVFLLYVLREWA